MIKELILGAALLYSIPSLTPRPDVDIGYTQKLMRWEIVADLQPIPRGEPTYYEPFVVEATGYSNPHGNPTYSGEETIEGITIAGKKEWIGSLVALYSMDENGKEQLKQAKLLTSIGRMLETPGAGVQDRSTSRLYQGKDSGCKDVSFQDLLDIELRKLGG